MEMAYWDGVERPCQRMNLSMESGPVAEDELDDFEDLEQSEKLQQLHALKMKQRELRTQLKSEKVVDFTPLFTPEQY